MKRLLLLIPVLAVLAGCGTGEGSRANRARNYDVGGVLMLDPNTGLQTTPLAADSVNLGMMDIEPGGTQLIRAVFPAPEGKTADILVPHFGVFRNVPVH